MPITLKKYDKENNVIIDEYDNPKLIQTILKCCNEFANEEICEKIIFFYVEDKDLIFDESGNLINTFADAITSEQYDYKKNEDNIKPYVFIYNKFKSNCCDTEKLDDRVLFLDSSIWLRFVYLTNDFDCENEENEKTETNQSEYNRTRVYNNHQILLNETKNNLPQLLKEIKQNFDDKLYEKNINLESFIFHSYLVKNVFSKKNHHVKPFTFHSETEMKNLLIKFLDHQQKVDDVNFHINSIKLLKWKLLLIAENDTNHVRTGIGKEERIEALLEKIAHKEKEHAKYTAASIKQEEKPPLNPTNNLVYSIETVSRNEQAIAKLKEEQYDIVLTEYLLENQEKPIAVIEAFENNKNRFKKGPFGKHWVFPVTVFSEAFFSDLRVHNLGHINNNSFINSGADPYNTPYFFLYKLIRFMNQQLKEVVFTVPHLLDLFELFLLNLQKDDKYIKRIASASYGELMYKYGRKSIIAFDKEAKSCLASSLYYSYLRNDADGVIQKFEHIREFLYLLSFGGNDDRIKLISELIFVNEQIKPLIIDRYDMHDPKVALIKKAFKKLNKFIYKLV